MERTKVQSEDI